MILLDTHTFIWWLSDRSKISEKALKVIKTFAKQRPILVSSISIWEACLLTSKKRINVKIPLDQWVKQLNDLPDI